MSTAIGDLVVTLGLDDKQFASGVGHSTSAMRELGKEAEEGSGHIGGASRALGFLGKQVQEGGELLGKENAQLGEMVSGLGGVTSGVGEAVHAYHALHTVMEIAIVKQTVLNALSGPTGWVTLAAGAVVAAGAYFYLSGSANDAAEKTKQLAEAAKKVREEAGRKVDSEISHLQEEADKLNKTPLENFRAELEQTGRSESQIEKLTQRFRELSAEVARAKDIAGASKDLHREGFEMATSHFTEGSRYLAKFHEEHPQATEAQNEQARTYARLIDLAKEKAEKERQSESVVKQEQEGWQRIRDEVDRINEGPLAHELKQLEDIKKAREAGMIGSGEATAAEAKIKAEMLHKMEQAAGEKAPELPKAEERGSEGAWKTILEAMQGANKQDLQQRQVDLLQEIRDGLNRPKPAPPGEPIGGGLLDF